MKSRRQALWYCLDTAVVVVIQIFHKFLLEVLHRIEFLQIEQFAFEQTDEVFRDSIVQTVSFPAHALPNVFLPEHPLVLFVLILPALIGMENQIGSIRNLLKSLIQHSRNHTQNRTVRDGIADQIAAAQIKDGREIELLSKQTELCHVGDPLLIRLLGMEVSV